MYWMLEIFIAVLVCVAVLAALAHAMAGSLAMIAALPYSSRWKETIMRWISNANGAMSSTSEFNLTLANALAGPKTELPPPTREERKWLRRTRAWFEGTVD